MASHIHTYDVIKEHHRMTWLRQSRIMKVTSSAVLNCKPSQKRKSIASAPSKAGSSPSQANSLSEDDFPDVIVTKKFPFSAITSVAVNGTTKFCLKIEGDHTYYYSSGNALAIAFEIQKRITASKAIVHLAEGAEMSLEERNVLMRSFCKGELVLPEFSDTDGTARKRAMTRRASSPPASQGNFSPQGSPSSRQQSEAQPTSDDYFLQTLALRLEIIKAYREGYFSSAQAAAKRLVHAYRGEQTEMITLQSLRADMDALLENFIHALSDLKTHHRFRGLAQEIEDDPEFLNRLADDILQEEVIDPLKDKLLESICLQSDLIGMQRKFTERSLLVSRRDPEEFGVSPLVLSMKFGLVTSLMKKLSCAYSPTRLLDMLVSIAKSIVLTVDANSRVADERRRSEFAQSQQRSANNSFSECQGLPSDNTVDNSSFASLNSPIKRIKNLSADDVLPLYIFLLSRCGLRDVIFLREWISKLMNGDECSERTYYFTVFSSAVEFILEGDPEKASCALSPQPSATMKMNLSSANLRDDADSDLGSLAESSEGVRLEGEMDEVASPEVPQEADEIELDEGEDDVVVDGSFASAELKSVGGQECDGGKQKSEESIALDDE